MCVFECFLASNIGWITCNLRIVHVFWQFNLSGQVQKKWGDLSVMLFDFSHSSTLGIGGVVAWNQQCRMTSQKGFIFSEPALQSFLCWTKTESRSCHGWNKEVDQYYVTILNFQSASTCTLSSWQHLRHIKQNYRIPSKVEHSYYLLLLVLQNWFIPPTIAYDTETNPPRIWY